MSNPYNNASDKMSILGPTLVFKGELTAEEDLMLKGRVEGSINHTASLKINNEGSVKGNIRAKHITVEGTVEGDLFGAESVTVQSSAQVTGNIYSRSVSLIEGSRFKGSIDMDYSDAAADASPTASSRDRRQVS
jgi:cytoskeletal protein CcmA (bactofilin family)